MVTPTPRVIYVTPEPRPAPFYDPDCTGAVPEPLVQPDVILVGHGDPGSLELRWDAPPAGWVTGWEYRVRPHHARPTVPTTGWPDWQPVPGSSRDTRSHLVTGLAGPRFYLAQVRAVGTGDTRVLHSVARGFNQAPDTTLIIGPGEIVEGDGETRWLSSSIHWTFIIPAGVVLQSARDGMIEWGSNSSITFIPGGAELSRVILPHPRCLDVDDVFDAIVDSLEPVP